MCLSITRGSRPFRKQLRPRAKASANWLIEIARHAEHLRESGDWTTRERSRLGSELDALLRETLVARFRERVPEIRYEDVLEQGFPA